MILTFEQWKQHEQDHRPASEIIECTACDGSGEKWCDCDCPHCENTIECAICEGKGKVKWGDLSAAEKSTLLTRHEYHKAAKADLIDIFKWTGDPAAIHAAGFVPFTHLKDRSTDLHHHYH